MEGVFHTTVGKASDAAVVKTPLEFVEGTRFLIYPSTRKVWFRPLAFSPPFVYDMSNTWKEVGFVKLFFLLVEPC